MSGGGLRELSAGESLRRTDLVQARNTLIGYLLMKAQAEDWHAVADAACDLRELDAELRGLQR